MIISASDDGICIELHGREQLWALRAKISIPGDTITNVEFLPRFQNWRKWEVRMPGTHLPTRLLAGSYWTEEGWDFLYIKRPAGFKSPRAENVLLIETDQDRYRRVIVSYDEIDSSGIIKWWNKTTTK